MAFLLGVKVSSLKPGELHEPRSIFHQPGGEGSTEVQGFYEALGFEYLGGEADQGWLILKNRSHVIGLFQGMFQGNLLTFNPGWNQEGQEEAPFTDIRKLARDCREKGLSVQDENTPGDSGPGSFTLTDPDGNVILVDQHR